MKYDVLTFGRSSIDLYSSNIGAPFVDIESFHAFVGGPPVNISVGTARLGLKSGIISCIGKDAVGDFVKSFLEKEQVCTRSLLTKEGKRTSAVILGIEPPDKFPLVFYRDNCADTEIDIDQVNNSNLNNCHILLMTGTAFAEEPCRSAALAAIEMANAASVKVVLDLDFRADQWPDMRSFGLSMRSVLDRCDIVIGTEEEIKAAMMTNNNSVVIKHQQISAPEISGDIRGDIDRLLQYRFSTLIVKTGEKGSTVYDKSHTKLTTQEVSGFPVDVKNILGAGDAFASGFIYGLRQGWNLEKSCRAGNACGALMVTKHGCANFAATLQEMTNFASLHGETF
ncbi:5-dehydro-2-deoxygluconokinase [Bacteriovoracaceae bacterium]|nr:5-dehydro-2-deoxygluconokinase [Bacteriovoracaceae bacterium]